MITRLLKNYLNMEEIKLSDDVIETIKVFDHLNLTEEQESLIDKQILNEELKRCYKEYGLCKNCKQPPNCYLWCRLCNFQQNFKNWTSGNPDVDKFIQKVQLKATRNAEVLEWIEYDRFENVEHLAQGVFGMIYKAIWKDGPIFRWDPKNNQWERDDVQAVALKWLDNSQDITDEFLKEVSNLLIIFKALTFCEY